MSKPVVSHAIYYPLAGKEAELTQLMQEFTAALHRNGFTTGRSITPASVPPGYVVASFEWVDNDEELEEAAGNHPEIKSLKTSMAACSAIPDMKEIKKIARGLLG